MIGQRVGSLVRSASLRVVREPLWKSSRMTTMSWEKRAAPPSPSSGESSLSTTAMAETGRLACPSPRVPLKVLLLSSELNVVRALWALT